MPALCAGADSLTLPSPEQVGQSPVPLQSAHSFIFLAASFSSPAPPQSAQTPVPEQSGQSIIPVFFLASVTRCVRAIFLIRSASFFALSSVLESSAVCHAFGRELAHPLRLAIAMIRFLIPLMLRFPSPARPRLRTAAITSSGFRIG